MERLFSDYRLFFCMLALGLYALLGAPTADHPGWVEGAIFILFTLSVGVGTFISLVDFQINQKKENWFLTAQIFLFFGLSMPLVMAVVNDSAPIDIIRDVIGFIFLTLPVFLYSLLNQKTRFDYFIIFNLFIGLIFSFRTLFPDIVFNLRGDELLYLANSPLVLFTSLFLIGYGGQKIFTQVTLKNFFIFIVAGVASIFCLAAMLEDTRRAAFVAVILTLFILLGVGVVKNPLRAIMSLVVIAGLCALFYQDIMVIIQQISLKTSQVGLNMRIQEWQAVWKSVNRDWITLIFGQGWGASFESPAVGGYPVTFTHSLLSAILLKTGLSGLLLCLIYLAFMFEKLIEVLFSNVVAGIALFWPFIIAVLFYASYKSLDFGLLLTLILIWHNFRNAPETA